MSLQNTSVAESGAKNLKHCFMVTCVLICVNPLMCVCVCVCACVCVCVSVLCMCDDVLYVHWQHFWNILHEPLACPMQILVAENSLVFSASSRKHMEDWIGAFKLAAHFSKKDNVCAGSVCAGGVCAWCMCW